MSHAAYVVFIVVRCKRKLQRFYAVLLHNFIRFVAAGLVTGVNEPVFVPAFYKDQIRFAHVRKMHGQLFFFGARRRAGAERKQYGGKQGK